MLCFFSTSDSVNAKSDKLIVNITSSYHVTLKENGRTVTKRISEKAAKKIKTFKKDFKNYEKKIVDEGQILDQNQDDVFGGNVQNINEDTLLSIPQTRIIVIPGDDGGGTGSELIVEAIDSTTIIYCTKGTYTYCKAYAESILGITHLETSISMFPNDAHGAHLKSVLTWDGSPNYSFTDFMSLGWEAGHVAPLTDTLKASTKVWFDYTHNDINNNIISSGSDIYEETLDYEPNMDVIVRYTDGIIWDIENVYMDYSGLSVILAPELRDSSDNFCETVEVQKVQYILETDLNLAGTASSYNDYASLAFQGDYRHSYPHITIEADSLTLISFFLTGLKGAIGVSITPTITVDSSRRTEIDVIFN